tara:strand:- start:210 stop:821 length:612 start_codon:yes stop_codon:yes gene_type:complete
MITIYGSPKTSAGRCFWTLEEVCQNYEAKSISLKENEHKSEEFLRVNPNAKIPALVDGDFTIWESMAINMYLADTYKPELLGTSSKERGLTSQWTLWANGDLQTPLIEIFIQKVFVPEEKRSQEVIDKAISKLPDLFNTIEMALDKTKFLASDEFTLADLNTESVVKICDRIGFDLSKYKNIQAWRSAISERPAFQNYMELCK